MPEQDKTINKILDSFINYKETAGDKIGKQMQSLSKEIVLTVKEIKQPDINITIPEIVIPEIKVPEVVVNERPIKDITVTGFLKWGASIIDLLGAILGKRIDLSSITKDNPIPVVLTHEGKFYKAVDKILAGGGTSPTILGLKNSSGATINPATSENQDTLITHLANVVSTVNSTSTPLGIGGVFTGTAEDVTKYASISVSAFSDKASATNGLSLQFSSDGTNWDNVDAHTTVANVAHVTTNAVQHKYFRVVYTNGGTAQTSFRLQTIYATEAIGPIIEEMGGDVSDTTSAVSTKSVLFAKNPGGVYGAINRTTGGNLKVSVEELEAGVATGPLATEAKQDTLNTNLLAQKLKPLSGAGVNGTRDLTSANTWYAVPSTVPTSDYVLVASVEVSAGTIRFGFSNSGTPSATNGNLAPGHLEIRLAANEVIYFASSTAGDDINFCTKVI